MTNWWKRLWCRHRWVMDHNDSRGMRRSGYIAVRVYAAACSKCGHTTIIDPRDASDSINRDAWLTRRSRMPAPAAQGPPYSRGPNR